MGELKRVLFFRGTILVLLLAAVVNLFLFNRQQEENNWGFPAHNAIQEPVDADAARALYNELEARYRNADPEAALAEVRLLAGEADLYRELQSSLQSWELYGKDDPDNTQWVLYYEDDYEEYMEQWPEEMEKLRSGWEPDWEALKIQTEAASKLEDQLTHLVAYRDYPAQVQAASERLSRFSIFGKEGSFARRNLQRTAEDFAPLEGAQLALGHDEALTALFSYPLADWILVLVLAYTAMAFLDERQKGLWHMLYAAPGGRTRLALRRAAVLALVSLMATALLHGGVLVLGFIRYGGWEDLDRAAQSLPIFKTLPVVTSVGGLLVRYFLLRAVTAFVIGLLLWLLLSAANTGVRWMIVGLAAFLAAEYACYTYLPDQSVFQVLKYGNIFCCIDLSVLFTRYVNLDVFGWPVNIRRLTEAGCVPLAAALGAGCAALQANMRPRNPISPFARLGRAWNALWDKLRGRLRLTWFEAYKLYVLQGGVLVLAVFLVLVARCDMAAQPNRTQAEEYALRLQGPLTEEKLEEIDSVRQEIDERYDLVLHASDRLQSGEIDWYTFSDIVSDNTNITAEQVGIRQVRLRAEELAARGEELGTDLWLLDETPYQSIYGPEASPLRLRWNVLVLFALSLLLAGTMAADQAAGLRSLLRAGGGGRGALLLRKYLLAGCGVFLLWAVPTAMELKTLMASADPASLAAPVQSLAFLEEFPLPVSIGLFLAGLYLLRLLILLALGCGVLFLSSLFRRPEPAYVTACAALVVPTVLWTWLGVGPLKFLSVGRAADLIGLLTERQGQPAAAMVVTAALLALGAICCYAAWRRWQGPGQKELRGHRE